MQVHRDIQSLPQFKNAAITIGTFDGVHAGHLKIIDQLKRVAQENEGESVLITFHPHPRMVISHGQGNQSRPIHLLNSLSEKIELLHNQQIDHLVIVPFTAEFSNQSAESYISDFLVKNFAPRTIITGYDHRFGKGRKGDYKMLEKYSEIYGYKVVEIPEHILHDVTISSTKIRQALIQGDINTANEYLGYDYFFEGKIIDGNKLGRTLGYPTANILVEDPHKLIPSYGVYAVRAILKKQHQNDLIFHGESTYKGMMNIGIRPTIGDGKIMTEVNLFDFNKDIYGRTLRVSIIKYLRPEMKFDSLEEMVQQIDRDKANSISILSSYSK